jgi:hypothetical protein
VKKVASRAEGMKRAKKVAMGAEGRIASGQPRFLLILFETSESSEDSHNLARRSKEYSVVLKAINKLSMRLVSRLDKMNKKLMERLKYIKERVKYVESLVRPPP